jgi:hypothetical protein
MGKTRNTGKLATQIQFDNSNNLVIGTSASSSFNTSGSVNAIGGITGSIYGIGNPTSFSSSISSNLISIQSVTASNIARLSNLETKSSSVDISVSSINTFTSSNANTSLNLLTSSLATTGSNTFKGTQIVSASMYVTGDFVVFGSSSIQYISASSVSIGTNIVQLNTANPAVRYAGLSVQDSGSAQGVTGSMLWDSVCNRWIYSNPSGVGYSGGVIMSGPRAATFGTETTLTCNYIAKSGGGDHLYDSCIIDDGTTVCINANLKGSGTACFAGTVCTPTIQSANVCTDGSYGSRVVAYGSNVGMFVNSTGAGEGYYRILNGACSIGALAATGWYKGSAEQNMGIVTGPSKSFQIATNDCANARLTIGADGISVFACQVCAGSVTACGIITANNSGASESILQSVMCYADGYRSTLRLNNAHTGGNIWELYSTNNTDGVYSGGKLGFRNTTTNVYAMTITCNGNVGIGTLSPTDCIVGSGTFIDISGTTGGGVKLHYSPLSTYGELSVYKGSNGSYIDSAGASTLANNDLILRTGGTTNNFGVTERLRINSSGVKFQNGSSYLNYYCQSNWTPQFYAAGTTSFGITQTGTGRFTRIGNVVTIHGQISWTGAGSAGSLLSIQNLPWKAVNDARGGISIGIISGIGNIASGGLQGIIEVNTCIIYFVTHCNDGNGHIHLGGDAVKSTGSRLFSFAGSYITDDN